MAAYNQDQEFADLMQVQKHLGWLTDAIKRKLPWEYTMTRWAEFYDALQFLDGVEDAATEMLEQTLSELGLDSEGCKPGPEGDFTGEREYIPLTRAAIAIERLAA